MLHSTRLHGVRFAVYINIDEGWLKSRDDKGNIVEDFKKVREGTWAGRTACVCRAALAGVLLHLNTLAISRP